MTTAVACGGGETKAPSISMVTLHLHDFSIHTANSQSWHQWPHTTAPAHHSCPCSLSSKGCWQKLTKVCTHLNTYLQHTGPFAESTCLASQPCCLAKEYDCSLCYSSWPELDLSCSNLQVCSISLNHWWQGLVIVITFLAVTFSSSNFRIFKGGINK